MVQPVGSILRPSRVIDLRTGSQKRIPWTPFGVSVLLFAHPSCGSCEAFAEALDQNASRFTDWGSSLWLVPADTASGDETGSTGSVGVFLDREGELRGSAGVAADDAAVVVIDVHGQVFYSQDLTDHDFPAMDDLALEARFPALQCPECETPDVPSQAQLPG